MKKAIFITVRSDSTRLPNKALLKILERPTIELVILRAKQVKGVDDIILCTTERSIDDEIVRIGRRNGIKHFRGSVEDKLERWRGAAREFNIDFFVTMDGDDLFCDPELIELAIKQMETARCDFLRAPQGLICGAFTYCIATQALERACLIKDTSDTEMMWVYFEQTGLFNVCDLDVKDKIYFNENIRLTLDYDEDFEFFTSVFAHFQSRNNDVPLREIVRFLDQNPSTIRINAFRQQDFLANQRQKTKLVTKNKPN
jgi:spore coat polysaccharide biosynthesis protein SpsF